MLPSDDTLTVEGLKPGAADADVRLIACGALAREILAVTEANGWRHLSLQCLPAILHNHPERITPAVEKAIEAAKAEGYRQIFVVYADCGTGGDLARLCDRLGVGMVPGPHCYAFFEGVDQFLARSENEFTSFYLTDFLVRQFDAFVWQPLGLDRHPELRDSYFGHYQKLVYLAQTDDEDLETKAQECASRLGLTYEFRRTGYGDLDVALSRAAKR